MYRIYVPGSQRFNVSCGKFVTLTNFEIRTEQNMLSLLKQTNLEGKLKGKIT